MKDIFEFDIKRFLRLVRNEYYANLAPFLTALGTVSIVMLAFNVVFRMPVASADGSSGWFLIFLFMGYIFTSLSFREIHQPQSGIFYLTLPASNFEKFLAKFLVYSVGYVVALAAALFLLSGAASLLDKLLFKQYGAIFNPFQKKVLLDIAVFMVIQSFFLFCAVAFKKLAFLKAILILAGAFLVLGIVIAAGMASFFKIVFDQGRMNAQGSLSFNSMQGGDLVQYLNPVFKNVVWPGLQIVFWAVLAPLFWVLSFLKFRRTEV